MTKGRGQTRLLRARKGRKGSSQAISRTPLRPNLLPSVGFLPRRPILSSRHGQRPDPPQNRPEHSPGKMPFRYQQPVVAGVLHQSATRLHQPPPQIPQVVGQYTQLQTHFVSPEVMATQPHHLHRLFAFFDPLFGCAALVVQPHHDPARRTQVGNDKAHSPEQLALVMAPPWPPLSGPSSN